MFYISMNWDLRLQQVKKNMLPVLDFHEIWLTYNMDRFYFEMVSWQGLEHVKF